MADPQTPPVVEPRLERVERRPLELRTPGEPLEGVERLVVVRDDRLGDFVLSIPAIVALRRTYPEAWLGLLVSESVAPLAGKLAGVDELLAVGDAPAERMQALERARPDTVVCISRDKTIAWAARMCRARHRVGTGRRFYSSLFTRTVDEPRREGGRHELEYALSFAHACGAEPAEPEWPLDLERAERSGPAPILLHPGSAGSCPRWTLRGFLELARALQQAGHEVVLSFGPSESGMLTSLVDDPRFGDIPRFDGELLELVALIDRSKLVVSNSTGPIHLAVARGVPALALHAPWPSCGVARWGPYAENGAGLVAWSEEALEWSRHQRRKRAQLLMKGLAVEAVAEAALGLL